MNLKHSCKIASIFAFVKKIIRWIFKAILKLFALSLVYLIICKWVMPPITVTQMVSFFEGNGLKREYVHKDQIATTAKLAAIAGEDQRFATHNGFDWKALKESFSHHKGRRSNGSAASTISQQTAKNVFLWQGSGFTKYLRKGLEFVYTQLIEWVWGKERILEVYLNVIEMGKGIYGIQAASMTYFGKNAKKLNRYEAASIIACLPNPKLYTVKPRSKFVNWKTNWILKQMRNIAEIKAIKALTHKN